LEYNIVNMKKNILGIILVIFLLFVLFLIKEKFTQAQSPIGIELYVYPRGFYGGGLMRIVDATERGKEGIYKNKRNSSVIAGTEYKLKLIGVSSDNFTLEFYKNDNITPLMKLENINCTSILGKQDGYDCIIEGTFNQPSSDYEKWTIVLKSGARRASTSFYLVKQSYAQNIGIASRDDQYYLEPTSTTTQPTSTINYTVYSNKLYCPSYMASGNSTATPNPSSGSFIHFSVASSSFLTNDSVSKALELRGISSGDYYLYLVNYANQRIGPTSSVRITVQSPFTPPPGAFECPGASGNWCRCVFSYCYWYDGRNWTATSSSVCGNVCTGGIRE
jgi:hypothetical protein